MGPGTESMTFPQCHKVAAAPGTFTFKAGKKKKGKNAIVTALFIRSIMHFP